MAAQNLTTKLAILADAAKYDASCASSGTAERHSKGGRGIGSTGGMGICHSYAPDGRCISLLKILLTNFCVYDCTYCVNRVSSSVPRARFSVDEVVRLTLDFYKRNYIEGLFLSSGIIQSSDYTMEQMVTVARRLREEADFRGYIHLKTIPEASPELLDLAGRYADRLSINIELPEEQSLTLLAPEKNTATIKRSMARLKGRIDEHKVARPRRGAVASLPGKSPRRARPALFAPAGQSTQMIVGADRASDKTILTTARALYRGYQMRRVYYSAFSPIQQSSRLLPAVAPPLLREHRLYQADWLMRFYHFQVDEIAGSGHCPEGMLDLSVDPKLAWALSHREHFPVDINTACREWLLRVPGIGARGADKLLQARTFRRLRLEDLGRCRVSIKKAAPFVQTADYNPHLKHLESPHLKQSLLAPGRAPEAQLALF